MGVSKTFCQCSKIFVSNRVPKARSVYVSVLQYLSAILLELHFMQQSSLSEPLGQYPVLNILGFPLPSKLNLCCTCRSRDKGVVSFAYAAALATKGAPFCRQSWKNKAKSRPIDRPRVATSLPSATGRTTLGQEGAIVFDRANIDFPGKHSPAEP